MKHITIVFLIAITTLSCKDKETYTATETAAEVTASEASSTKGKKLMEQQCYVCHSPDASEKDRIAPPMVAIKSHYLSDDTTQQEFADAIWNFVKKPNEEKSKMKGAVRRFGLMPYQPYKEEDIYAIANYMFEYKIAEPAWYKSHLEEKGHKKMKYRNDGKIEVKTTEKTATERGMQYALSTKKELGKNLMGTIQKKGTLEAVAFCNVQAYPITDSMAIVHNARIKRVSDKPRNPNNAASTDELAYIQQFKKDLAAGTEIQPVVKENADKTHFYYPIITNSMCLQCHGDSQEDIEPAVLSKINELYPQDLATEYDINKVRGMWAMSFDTKD